MGGAHQRQIVPRPHLHLWNTFWGCLLFPEWKWSYSTLNYYTFPLHQSVEAWGAHQRGIAPRPLLYFGLTFALPRVTSGYFFLYLGLPLALPWATFLPFAVSLPPLIYSSVKSLHHCHIHQYHLHHEYGQNCRPEETDPNTYLHISINSVSDVSMLADVRLIYQTELQWSLQEMHISWCGRCNWMDKEHWETTASPCLSNWRCLQLSCGSVSKHVMQCWLESVCQSWHHPNPGHFQTPLALCTLHNSEKCKVQYSLQRAKMLDAYC